MKCPKCGYLRKETDIAREGECPSCGVFYAKVQSRSEPVTKQAAELSGGTLPTPSARRVSLPVWVIPSLVALVAGFFIGREHLKYEIRQSLQAAAEGIRTNLESGRVREETTSPARGEEAPESAPDPFAVELISKGYQAADYSAQIDEAIIFSIKIRNRSGKDVRAFEGVLTFIDLLDNEIISSRLTIEDPIKSGEDLTWPGELDFNQFIDRHKRLRGADQSSLKVRFRTTKILYSDGTVLENK